jgi:hypothetical protein
VSFVTNKREVAILVGKHLSLAQTLLTFERDGFEVVDVLPLLRALILNITTAQYHHLMDEDYVWQKKLTVKTAHNESFD